MIPVRTKKAPTRSQVEAQVCVFSRWIQNERVTPDAPAFEELHFRIDPYALRIRAADRPCDGRHQKRECATNLFVSLLVRHYRIDALALRWPASHHIAVQGPFSAMRNELSDKYTPRPPHCPSCAQLMPLARTTSRFGNLPDLYIFECRACGVSHIDAVEIEAAQTAVRAKS